MRTVSIENFAIKFYYMRLMNALPTVLAVLFFVSCSSDAEKTEKELKQEIMTIHDELMPQMDNLDTLRKELEKNRGYLTSDSVPVNGPLLAPAEFDSLIQALENANESMMSWMRNYNQFDEADFTHEEQVEYLQKEKEKIETVRLKMISSIKEAESLLNREVKPLEIEN